MIESSGSGNESAGDTVRLQVTATVVAEAGSVAEKQAQIAELLAGIGGVAVTIDVGYPQMTERATVSRPEVFGRALYDVDWPEETPAPLAKRIANSLRRERLYTIGDVLMVGRHYVLSVRNLGKAALETLQLMIERNAGPDYPWLNKPAAADIVRYADDLRQVPANILSYKCGGLSVQDLVDLSEEEKRTRFSHEVRDYKTDTNRLEFNAAEVNHWVMDAKEFQANFDAARHQLEQSGRETS